MKRLLLSILSVICLSSAAYSANQQSAEDYEKYLTDTPIQHPLFEKVFPGVIIADERDEGIQPTQHRLVALFQGKRWQMPVEFNRLYGEVAAKSKASVAERLETYLRMVYWYQDANLVIISHEKTAEEVSKEVPFGKFPLTYNHRFILGFHKGSEIQKVEIIIGFHRDQVLHWKTVNPTGIEFKHPGPPLYNHTDNPSLQIFGMTPQTY